MPHANYGTVKLHIQEEWEPTTAEEERYIEEDQRSILGTAKVLTRFENMPARLLIHYTTRIEIMKKGQQKTCRLLFLV